jgi:CRP-like cAMP-binding protein
MDEIADLPLKKEFVKNQACFANLTEVEKDKLATLLNERIVPAGEVIVTEGEPVDSVFLIVNGKADVQKMTIKPDHTTETHSVATLGPGAAIGLNETGFYSLSGLRTATVIALTEMKLLHLNIAEFHGFALENSHVNEVMRQNAENISKE